MIKWIRRRIANKLIELYKWMDKQEIHQKDMSQADWIKAKELAEYELELSRKIQSYAIEQSNTPLNRIRGGSPTLKVVKGETADLVKPLVYNPDTRIIYLKRRLAGLEDY